MPENYVYGLKGALKRLIQALLKLSMLRVAVLFLALAIVISLMIVLIIDFLWDGRFSAELEFAGVVVPFLDGMLIVGLLVALLHELRKEVEGRKAAENALLNLNRALETTVRQCTQQLETAQEELVRQEKLALLGLVADTVGHELRNPLGVMNNAVYFLQTVLVDADETTREYLGIIKEEIVAAERIVSGLLDAVRTKPPQLETVEVAPLIVQTLAKCEVPAAVTVRMDIPERLAAIQVDQGQIRQVLWNLIRNGVEAMPDGGALEIDVDEDQTAKTVMISIKDSGSGIAPENLSKLFEPMFTTKVRRVGLGLAVAKNLTESNGGSIGVESVSGNGSRFFVILPCAEDDRIVNVYEIAGKERKRS